MRGSGRLLLKRLKWGKSENRRRPYGNPNISINKQSLSLRSFLNNWMCILPSSGQLVCTMDVKMCPDGSYVARNPDMGCEFNACPPLRDCAAGNPCPNGEDCYDFQNDEREAYCFRGDPCLICPSGQCDVLESFPPQVVCR